MGAPLSSANDRSPRLLVPMWLLQGELWSHSGREQTVGKQECCTYEWQEKNFLSLGPGLIRHH